MPGGPKGGTLHSGGSMFRCRGAVTIAVLAALVLGCVAKELYLAYFPAEVSSGKAAQDVQKR